MDLPVSGTTAGLSYGDGASRPNSTSRPPLTEVTWLHLRSLAAVELSVELADADVDMRLRRYLLCLGSPENDFARGNVEYESANEPSGILRLPGLTSEDDDLHNHFSAKVSKGYCEKLVKALNARYS